jgi:hypothetical protein
VLVGTACEYSIVHYFIEYYCQFLPHELNTPSSTMLDITTSSSHKLVQSFNQGFNSILGTVHT